MTANSNPVEAPSKQSPYIELYTVSPDHEEKLLRWLEQVAVFCRGFLPETKEQVIEVNRIISKVIGLKAQKMKCDKEPVLEEEDIKKIQDMSYLQKADWNAKRRTQKREQLNESNEIHDQIYQCAVQGEQLLQLILDMQETQEVESKRGGGRPSEVKFNEDLCNISWNKKTVNLTRNSERFFLCQKCFSKESKVGDEISWIEVFDHVYKDGKEDWKKIYQLISSLNKRCKKEGFTCGPILEIKGGEKGVVKRLR